MAPENGWLEDEFPFCRKACFQGQTVSFREGVHFRNHSNLSQNLISILHKEFKRLCRLFGTTMAFLDATNGRFFKGVVLCRLAMNNEKGAPGCLGYIVGIVLPSHVGIIL